MDNCLMLSFPSPCGGYTLFFEDDGKVAYAYLHDSHNAIIGDVWLYNRCAAPTCAEWQDKKNIPFANCQGYMSEEGRMTRQIIAMDVALEWEYENGRPEAYVYIVDDLYGIVGPGDKPGFARFATRNGPLARTIEVECK